MAGKDRQYRKLPGTSVGAVTRTKLWLASDHLLSVQSTGFSEAYKRFYFRDIQAFTIRRTSRGRTINMILAVAGFFPLLALVLSLRNPVLATVWAVLASLILFSLLLNSILGPTCEFQIKTAVQTETLASLGRLPRARHVAGGLHSRIVTAQADVRSASAAHTVEATVSTEPGINFPASAPAAGTPEAPPGP